MAEGEAVAHEPADARPPGIEEARAWAGWRLDELKGTRAGRVEGLCVDATGGESEWILVRMGRFGHHTAIPLSLTAGGVRCVWTPFTRETMRAAPRLEPGEPLTPELEQELRRHYAVPV